ncbi:hypothetical protein BD311DRAFT_820544 [Dichomitus squalens]|uniref:Secreted protein n=1 Tax=Dichomitus squalens TaxID=114155 RepID=A0A4Q9MWL3_9APHY|nr:hypothetical protein BD311DRAFT_820544 [Dichomitus squalens]
MAHMPTNLASLAAFRYACLLAIPLCSASITVSWAVLHPGTRSSRGTVSHRGHVKRLSTIPGTLRGDIYVMRVDAPCLCLELYLCRSFEGRQCGSSKAYWGCTHALIASSDACRRCSPSLACFTDIVHHAPPRDSLVQRGGLSYRTGGLESTRTCTHTRSPFYRSNPSYVTSFTRLWAG